MTAQTTRLAARQAGKLFKNTPGLTPRAGEYLARAIFGLTPHELHTQSRPLTPGEQKAWQDALERVLAGEPLQYVLGEWDFCGHIFKVDSRALIPREETEALVYWAIDTAPALARVADLGCGCGCVGIALKLARPDLDVMLMDIDPGALALAGENARRLGAEVTLRRGDMRRPLGGEFHVLLCNPPYIGQGERGEMDEAVLRYEPHGALFAGMDGYEYHIALAERAADSLAPGGIMAAECGFAQAERVKEIWAHELDGLQAHLDFAGHQRIITGRKP